MEKHLGGSNCTFHTYCLIRTFCLGISSFLRMSLSLHLISDTFLAPHFYISSFKATLETHLPMPTCSNLVTFAKATVDYQQLWSLNSFDATEGMESLCWGRLFCWSVWCVTPTPYEPTWSMMKFEYWIYWINESSYKLMYCKCHWVCNASYFCQMFWFW